MEITLDGRTAYAYTGGKRFDAGLPAVVFIHGAAQDHSCWSLQSRWFAHHGHAVLVPDLPGHGRSPGPALASVEALAAWIVDLLDATNVARATLVGHSMGSLAALAAAAAHPDRIDRIALVGSAVPMPVVEMLLDAAATDEPRAVAMVNAWSHSARGSTGGNAVPGMWLPGADSRLMRRQRRGVLHTDLAACNAYAGGTAAMAGVRCPALVIAGSRDRMTGAKAARTLAAGMPSARLAVIDGAGHALMGEAPDALLDALRGFIAA